jgi:hypothetical protein
VGLLVFPLLWCRLTRADCCWLVLVTVLLVLLLTMS